MTVTVLNLTTLTQVTTSYDGGGLGVAVDPAANMFFAARGTEFVSIDTRTFGVRDFVSPSAAQGWFGVAVDPGLHRVYVTNIVKHFKWVARGKRRIHQSPNQTEVLACRPWLQAEILVVKPKVIVALGATAAKALIGSKFKVTLDRGRVIEVPRLGAPVVATVHPASILRSEDREAGTAAFIADLKAVARYLKA